MKICISIDVEVIDLSYTLDVYHKSLTGNINKNPHNSKPANDEAPSSQGCAETELGDSWEAHCETFITNF